MGRTAYLLDVRQDVGYAVRLLRRTPGFAAIAVVTIALGIGASTAIFTVVDSVLLRPLSFAEPHQLTMIRPTSGSRLSPTYLHEWRLGGAAFRDMVGWFDVRVTVAGGEAPFEVLADRVTTNFFALLGTPALLGRTFAFGPDLSRVAPEVVLSQGFWHRRYGGDRSVVGRPITLDGQIHTIVGVMPQGFSVRTTELAESRAEVWLPFALVPEDGPGMGGTLNVVARLAPGVSPAQAQAELSAIARRIEEVHPSYSRDWGVQVLPLLDATVKDVRLSLLVLFGAVGILLLTACANVANLVLGRAATRRTELAIRHSIGATSGRLLRQFLTEGFVLAAAGGVLGILLAIWGTHILVAALPAGFDLPRVREINVDARVLLFASFVTIVTAILFGLAPLASSLSATAVMRRSRLREATSGSLIGQKRNSLGSALVVSEVALSLVLLSGAGLLGRSFLALSRVDPGFQAPNVLTMRTTLPASKYDTKDRMRAFGAELLERIERLPGIRAVGSVNYLPMTRFGAANRFEIEGRPETRIEDQKFSWVSVVGGRYFDAMGIPLLRGRLPDDADSEKTPPVVVIDQELARRFWTGRDPIGTRIVWHGAADKPLVSEIVGVVGGVRWAGMASGVQATTYFWFPQDPGRELTIVTRTDGDPLSTADVVAAQVGHIDPNQPVAEIRAMVDVVSSDLAQPRFTLVLLGGFASAALLLTAIGLYGVIAFGVTERTREIGVRMALGAQYRDVLRMVMRRGVLLTGTGLVIGMVVALALGRVVSGLLYGVAPSDPVTLLAAALFLGAVALLAAYLPARRAARVDPMVALRAE